MPVPQCGKVKWFNGTHGFIEPDNGDPDVFVHHTVILTEGFRTLVKGERVHFNSVASEKGPRAIWVAPFREGTLDKVERCEGVVAKFDPKEGFGFIDVGDIEGDVFVHRKAIQDGRDFLAEGDEVELDIHPTPPGQKNRFAKNVVKLKRVTTY